jgi:anti-sigma B factor antagonist
MSGTSGGAIRLTVAGEIDIATVADLISALNSAVITEGATMIVADFGDVTFCDSSGMAALDNAYHEAQLRGLGFQLVNVQRGLRRLLELTGILDHLTRGADDRRPAGRLGDSGR